MLNKRKQKEKAYEKQTRYDWPLYIAKMTLKSPMHLIILLRHFVIHAAPVALRGPNDWLADQHLSHSFVFESSTWEYLAPRLVEGSLQLWRAAEEEKKPHAAASR